MSETLSLRCPACGAYLTFDPQGERLVCPFCDAAYTRAQAEAQQGQAEASSGGTKAYHCPACGAEVVTEATTAATFCYYCHSPVTLMDRVSDAFQPDGVIPFSVSKEDAWGRFRQFTAAKRFLPRDFANDAAVEKFAGVYFPYWVGDITGAGEYQGQGTRVSIASTPRFDVVTTRFYNIRRKGRLDFRQMIRHALKGGDQTIAYGVHPYRLQGLRAFSPAYLSGFFAQKREVEAADAQGSMVQEAQSYAERLMTDGLRYDTLRGSAAFTPGRCQLRYVLLPAWVITYRGDKPGATYYYMVNGQTGAVCGRLPIHWGKLLAAALLAGAAVCALLCAGGALLW